MALSGSPIPATARCARSTRTDMCAPGRPIRSTRPRPCWCGRWRWRSRTTASSTSPNCRRGACCSLRRMAARACSPAKAPRNGSHGLPRCGWRATAACCWPMPKAIACTGWCRATRTTTSTWRWPMARSARRRSARCRRRATAGRWPRRTAGTRWSARSARCAAISRWGKPQPSAQRPGHPRRRRRGGARHRRRQGGQSAGGVEFRWPGRRHVHRRTVLHPHARRPHRAGGAHSIPRACS